MTQRVRGESRVAWAALAVILGGACGESTALRDGDFDAAQRTAAARETTNSRLAVFASLAFTRMGKDGRVPGFNLDGKHSSSDDDSTCNKPDFVSPAGEPGIDNRFAMLVPVIEQGGLSAVEGLLQGAVDDGGLLMMLQVDGLDDAFEDDSVEVRLRAGSGKPLLGTDGAVLSGQTFHLHPASPEALAKKARVSGGVLEAGPLDVMLPLTVFGIHYAFEIRGARIRARLLDNGDMEDGLFGGGLLADDLVQISVKAERFEKGVSQLVKPLAQATGDLDRTSAGHCAQISMALRFRAVSAFLWD